MTERPSDLAVLARAGGNDQVVEKKVLLAHLARQEAARLGIVPDAQQVQALGATFLRELELRDSRSVRAWLHESGLSDEDFERVMADFAAVLAVEAHHRQELATRVELHRKLIAGRSRILAEPA